MAKIPMFEYVSLKFWRYCRSIAKFDCINTVAKDSYLLFNMQKYVLLVTTYT